MSNRSDALANKPAQAASQADGLSNTIGKFLYSSGLSFLYDKTFRGVGCAVLAYHRICPEDEVPGYDKRMTVAPAVFERQMEYLRSHYVPLSLSQLIAGLTGADNLPPNAVHVTFDDGYMDVYEYALPILKRYGIPATVFLTFDYVDTDRMFWWDQLGNALQTANRTRLSFALDGQMINLDLGDEARKANAFFTLRDMLWGAKTVSPDEAVKEIQLACGSQDDGGARDILSWDRIREMLASDIDFGSHTCSHPKLSSLTDEHLAREIELSKRKIEDVLQTEVTSIAYPFGGAHDYDGRTVEAVRSAGYRIGLTGIQGLARPGDDLFQVRRVPIRSTFTMDLFRAKVSGAFPAFYNGCRKMMGRRNAN